MLERMKRIARRMKQQLSVLSYAIEHPRLPRHIKWGIIALIAYTVSPIDLIPDFLPVIGLLDDLLLVPLGIYFIIRSIPKEILTQAQRRLEQQGTRSFPLLRRYGLAFVFVCWGIGIGLVIWWIV
ncbi:YkvA family protein [Exiguobacterium sp.]|uniref:YkvA family protein n=1 Tax=Exiguobacterium sp. TaxID=44751 RepID=UPI0037C055E5